MTQFLRHWGPVPDTRKRAIYLHFETTDARPLHVIGWYLPPDYKRPPQATQTEIMGGVQRYIQTLPSSYRLLLVGDTNIQTVRGLGGVMGKWCVRATLQELTKRKQAATQALVRFCQENDLVVAST